MEVGLHIHIHTCVCVHIYIYIEREAKRGEIMLFMLQIAFICLMEVYFNFI